MKNIGRILSLSKRFNVWFALSCLLIIIGVLINLALPIFSKLIVDQIASQISGKGGSLNNLLTYVAFFFIAGVAGNLFNSLSNRVGDHIAGKLRAYWTETFYYKIVIFYYTSRAQPLESRVFTILFFIQFSKTIFGKKHELILHGSRI